MKRLLSILGAIMLVLGASTTMIGCANLNGQVNDRKDLNNVVKVKDLNFIDYDMDSQSDEELNTIVLSAIKKKNPKATFSAQDVKFHLILKNKEGDFWKMVIQPSDDCLTLKGEAVVSFSMTTDIGILVNHQEVFLGEFTEKDEGQFLSWRPGNYIMNPDNLRSHAIDAIEYIKSHNNAYGAEIIATVPKWDPEKKIGTAEITITKRYYGSIKVYYTINDANTKAKKDSSKV